MSFAFFQILALIEFGLGGVWLYRAKFNSVEEIIAGFVILWGMVIILLSGHSVWKKFEVFREHPTKIPQTESYRLTLAAGLTNFVLSFVLLISTAHFDASVVFWLIILISSMKMLAGLSKRGPFQIKAAHRFNRRRKLRFKNA